MCASSWSPLYRQRHGDSTGIRAGIHVRGFFRGFFCGPCWGSECRSHVSFGPLTSGATPHRKGDSFRRGWLLSGRALWCEPDRGPRRVGRSPSNVQGAGKKPDSGVDSARKRPDRAHNCQEHLEKPETPYRESPLKPISRDYKTQNSRLNSIISHLIEKQRAQEDLQRGHPARARQKARRACVSRIGVSR